MTESMYDAAAIRANLRMVPKVETKDEALAEILKLATDKRSHVLLVDCNAWLELKVKAIAKLARRGRRAKS